jgi:hypothetical protein
VGVAQLDVRHLGFAGDASFQNFAEFIASIAAVRGAQQLRDKGVNLDGRPIDGVWLRGDSVTALNLVVEGTVKSELALNESMVCTVNSVTARKPILGTTHLPAQLIFNADLFT